MGFIKAFTGALSSSFANQWLEYLAPSGNLSGSVMAVSATTVKVNGSQNNDGQENANIISNGSKFMVPEGTCLIVTKNGGIEAVIAEPGGYTYTTQDTPEAKSMFAGDGFFASTFGASFEQFKYGGQPGNEQHAFYVTLTEIMGNRYGTQNPIRYKDANYANTMLAVTSNGTYDIKIIDPVLFAKNLLPTEMYTGKMSSFSLEGTSEAETRVSDSLFAGFVGSLATALSSFTKGGKSIDDIQGGTSSFAQDMDAAVEANYQWATRFGLAVTKVMPMGLDWDEQSIELINKFNMGNLMQGGVGAAYAQTQIAEGLNAAGQQGGSAGMMGMGFGVGMMGGMMPGMMNGAGVGVNPVTAQQQAAAAPAAPVAAPAPEAAPAAAPAEATPAAPATDAAAPAPEAPAADAGASPETPAAPAA